MTQQDPKELGVQQVIWKLEDLYSGSDDPQIQHDLEQCRQKAGQLNTEYLGRVAQLGPEEILQLVQALEANDALVSRLATYAFLNFSTQTGSGGASALLQKVEEFASEVGQKTVFFQLEWNGLEEDSAAKLLDAPCLSHFRYYLSSLRRFAPHQLSRPEEELLHQFGPVGRNAWNVLFDKVMASLRFGEKERSEEEVLADLYSADRMVRKQASDELTGGLNSSLHVLTHIFNTLASEKMISDRVRSYAQWSSQMDLENGLEAETVQTLVQVVTSRYDLVQQYYQTKKGLLSLDTLTDYDRYAPVPAPGGVQVINWQECQAIVLDAFAAFSQEMHDIALQFFEKQWIHAPVGEGKRGGAFAHPCVPEVHPYVMVNYTGGMRDVSTVAHELGHGVHQFLAAEQGYYNSDTPLVLAETASVFAEFLVFKKQLAYFVDPDDRRAFICQKVESIFATVFRQISMNRFEHSMHSRRREQGELSSEDLSQIWLETQAAMFGSSVQLTENYQIWWSYIGHFLSVPGYVYSYAFGELLVLALYSRYEQQGQVFVDHYLDLLRSGGNGSPYDLLKPFDIDLNSPQFWQGGMTVIESLLSQIE